MPDQPAAAPPAPPAESRLPESMGAVANNDYKTDIDKYFDNPEGGAPPVAEPAKQPVVEPVVAKVEPRPGSLASKLSAKFAPPPKADPPAAPAAPEDPVAKIEAEFKAHNPKWKPAQGWDALKTTLKTAEDKRAALEKELEATKARAASPILAGMTTEEIEGLKAREKSASDRLLVMDLESHPTFRAQYVEPKNAEIAKANELLAMAGVKTDVAALLSKPRSELGKAVTELVKDMPDFDRVEVAESIRKAYSLEQGSKAALAQAKELQKGLQAKTVERQRNAFATRWAPVSAALGEHIVELEVPADATPEQRADIEGYNSDLKGLRAKAEAIAFSPMDEEAIAENSMKAAAYEFHIQKAMPRIISEYEEVVNLNRQLVEEVKALRSRNPNHGIKPSPAAGDSPETDPSKMDHAKAADYFFRK